MKWVIYAVLALVVIGGWTMFVGNNKKIAEMRQQAFELRNEGDPEKDEEVQQKIQAADSAENSKTFTGVLLAFLTAGLVGIIVVVEVLPAIAQRFTHAVYDSAEEVEADPLHDARAKVAQGDWEGAIEAFKLAAVADPLNRLPWVEIAKIQLDQLEQPAAAVQTLRHAVEDHEWQENDAAYLMFRLAEIYDTEMHDRVSAGAIMQQVMEQFPESRHFANARHKLHEWGMA
jgi:tetratricopeptide (TPR) repeat protein